MVTDSSNSSAISSIDFPLESFLWINCLSSSIRPSSIPAFRPSSRPAPLLVRERSNHHFVSPDSPDDVFLVCGRGNWPLCCAPSDTACTQTCQDGFSVNMGSTRESPHLKDSPLKYRMFPWQASADGRAGPIDAARPK